MVHYVAGLFPLSYDLCATEVVVAAAFAAVGDAVGVRLWISGIETPRESYLARCPCFRAHGVLIGRNVDSKSAGLKVETDSMILYCVTDFARKCASDCPFFKTQN